MSFVLNLKLKKKNRQIDDGTREKQYFNKFQSIFFLEKKNNNQNPI